MTKATTKRFDCVEAKRQAQLGLTQAIAGNSPTKQVEILRQLAEQSPLWRKLGSPQRRSPAAATTATKTRKLP